MAGAGGDKRLQQKNQQRQCCCVIERLDTSSAVSPPDVRSLARLLVEAVEADDAVSFLAPLSIERAEEWWSGVVSNLCGAGAGAGHSRSFVLVARDDQQESNEIVGTVQVHASWAPNQPHRAEVTKLLVDSRWRRKGIGAALMQAAENEARDAGFRLLTLDAKRGGGAERLYRRLGWIHAGTIPRFALDPDGQTLHDAVIFYKELLPPAGDVLSVRQ